MFEVKVWLRIRRCVLMWFRFAVRLGRDCMLRGTICMLRVQTRTSGSDDIPQIRLQTAWTYAPSYRPTKLGANDFCPEKIPICHCRNHEISSRIQKWCILFVEQYFLKSSSITVKQCLLHGRSVVNEVSIITQDVTKR